MTSSHNLLRSVRKGRDYQYYYIDGKRVPRSEYQFTEIWFSRWECLSTTVTKTGVIQHRKRVVKEE